MKEVFLSARFNLLRVLGRPGLMGLTLLVMAALIGVFFSPQARKEKTALLAELISVKSNAAQVIEQRRNKPSTDSQLQAFLEWLPPLSTNADDVEKLFILAKETGIDLTKADYQLTVEPGLGLARYQVTVQVKEKYLVVRRFATGALNALPHLALDEIQFARAQASTDELTAQLRFTIFYRPQ